jgi:hypothetical protein
MHGVLSVYSYNEAVGEEILARVDNGRYRGDGYRSILFLNALDGDNVNDSQVLSELSGDDGTGVGTNEEGEEEEEISGRNVKRTRMILLRTREHVLYLPQVCERLCLNKNHSIRFKG